MQTDRRLAGILEGIRIEPVGAAHLKEIAELHFGQLSWSFSGQFGQGHILELYQAIARSPHFFGYACYGRGELLGFVTATTDYEDTRRLAVEVFRRKLPRALWVFARSPRFLLTALESRFAVPLVFRRFGARAEWLTFVTDTSKGYISPFVALRLISALNDHFRDAGIAIYMAQGFKNNPKAMRYYEKLKWRVAQPLLMHNVYYYTTARADP